jgi:hypothetical protein
MRVDSAVALAHPSREPKRPRAERGIFLSFRTIIIRSQPSNFAPHTPNEQTITPELEVILQPLQTIGTVTVVAHELLSDSCIESLCLLGDRIAPLHCLTDKLLIFNAC